MMSAEVFLEPALRYTLQALNSDEKDLLCKLSRKQLTQWIEGEVDLYGNSLRHTCYWGQALWVQIGLIEEPLVEKLRAYCRTEGFKSSY